MTVPFYNPNLSYQENYDRGPFGLFAEEAPPLERPMPAVPPLRGGVAPAEFLGAPLGLPIGIPAGPLLNAAFVAAAFRWGYDLCHYKTVRSRYWPSHPSPNVMRVGVAAPLRDDGKAQPTLRAQPFAADGALPAAAVSSLSITNSFGMPAQPPAAWQADVGRALEAAGPGQILAVSVVGTADPGDGPAEFTADFARAAVMAADAGATLIEANLSCPNIGGHGLLCHDIEQARAVCEAIRERVPDRRLLVKLGSYSSTQAGEDALASLVEALAPYVAGFSAINAVPYPVLGGDGEQALPGAARLRAGICGAAIREIGLDVARRLAALRDASGARWGIIGVGGVMSPADYASYREAGADVVQAAAGPMWRPQLALEIAEHEKGAAR
ncbi:MAG: diguanylate cyclase [Chloroflexia bacterium]